MQMIEQKRELRAYYIQKRSLLSQQYCKESDQRIAEQLVNLEAYQQAKTVFFFVATADEIDTMPMIRRALEHGKNVGVPKCTDKGFMEVRLITEETQLEPGRFGILEPVDRCPVIAPREIDLAVLPCLSCTADGIRLGYGGGYYDRYLSGTKCFKVVICRSKLLARTLPREPHDVCADLVVVG